MANTQNRRQSLIRKRRRGPAAGLGIVLALVMIAGGLLPVVTANAQISGGIEFINPGPRNPMDPADDRGHTRIVSDREAGGDQTYRFAAWVESVPADPVVEFEIVVSAIETRTIGTAVRADDNVWELQWNIQGIIDGDYTVRAKLFSGFNQVGQDEQAIQLRHGEVDSSIAAPRARIVGIGQGGIQGFYTPPGSDVATTPIGVVASSGATRVRGFYTTTPVGQPPEWAECANETTGSAEDGLHCNLAGGTNPMTVTALAVVANDTRTGSTADDPPRDQAGDAIHITPYVQIPSQVLPSEPISDSSGACPAFQVQVLDQSGRPVSRVNMDFHAVGPSDNLRFDVGSLATILLAPDAKAPDVGLHTYEQGYDCVGQRISPDEGFEQGEHDRPVLADIKHLETFSGTGTFNSGTSDDGFETEFIRSPDAGDTHITAWADLNDDDGWSSGEPCAVTAVRWFTGEEPDSPPTPQAEFEGCTIAVPDPEGPQPGETPPSSVDLQPEQRTAATGDVHTLTATATDAQGNPTPNEPVTWQSDGVGEIVNADERTDSGGRAQVQVTSEEEGEQTITVSTNRCATGGPCSDTAQVTWSESVVRRGPCEGFAHNSRQPREDGVDGWVVVGGPGDDNLLGTPGDDIICGLGGADTIEGFEGGDLVVGGGGADTVNGAAGNDRIRGNGGRDVLRGQGGADRIRGGAGRDVLRGNRGRDRLFGGPHNDRLFGGRGNDRCVGGQGNDRSRGCER